MTIGASVRLCAGFAAVLTVLSCTAGTRREPAGPAAAGGGAAATPGPAPTGPPQPGRVSPAPGGPGAGARAGGVAIPRPDHVLVLVLENHGYADVIGQPDAAYLNTLAGAGTLLTQSYAVAHPSEPNYLALFSGSTQDLGGDPCPVSFRGSNLARSLLGAHLSFVGYSEDLPTPGFTGCSAGSYARKHNPWVDFPALPAAVNQPMTAFPTDYRQLPTVAFVVPNLDHDMHDGSVAQGDRWVRDRLDGYAVWASGHNSLFIVTWDEGDGGADNRVATIIVGAHVVSARTGEHVTHYGLLRTIEDCYGLPLLGHSAQAAPLTGLGTG